MAAYRNKKTAALEDALTAHTGQVLTQEERFAFARFDTDAAERGGYSNYSYWGSALRCFFQNKVAVFFLIVIAATLLFTFLQPHLPGQKEADRIYQSETTGLRMTNQPPGEEFWFGTNAIGQDLWSQIWAGARTSLFIGFTVALVETLLGILAGVLWGYVRKADVIFTELYNVFDNVPQTLVLILVSYIMRPGITTMIFAMCLTSWLQTARFVRNQIVIIRDRDYNLASRCLGTPSRRIILKNLLPYLVSIITLRMALSIPAAIGNEVFITYIGLGLPLSIPSLGNLIDSGRMLMTTPTLRYQLIFPVVVLSVVTVSFYIIGNAFADAADPKNHV